jgi:hypothetical protein
MRWQAIRDHRRGEKYNVGGEHLDEARRLSRLR